MRDRVRTLLAAVLIGGFVSVALPPTPAHAAGRMDLFPNRGRAGSAVDVALVDYGIFCWIKVAWDAPNGERLAFVPPWTDRVTIVVPADAPPGLHTIHTTQCLGRVDATFEVVAPPSRPKPDPRPTKPPSQPDPTPTGAPRPPTKPAPSTPTGAPTPGPAGPGDPPSNSPAPGHTPPVVRRNDALVLDRVYIRPGESLTAHGAGCAPRAPVTLTSDGESLGTATSNESGEFVAQARFAAVQPGRRVVTARCGKELTADVDIVLSSATAGPLSTMLPLLLCVLLGAVAVGWQYVAVRRRDPAVAPPGRNRPSGNDEIA